jgi:glycosyltransferase involved in cell wall biosynthesis
VRITFVLPFPFATGGVRVVAQYAERLRAMGHSTAVVFPALPYRFRSSPRPGSGLASWCGTLASNLIHGSSPPGALLRGGATRVPWIADRFLPDADAVVATAWPTAPSVSRLTPAKGAKCYLVQHREVDSGLAEEVDATYRLPLFRIAGSRFTADELRREVGVEVDAVVPNGVDVDFWSSPGDEVAERSGVLMPYRAEERKGGADGLAALEIVHRERPETPIRLFGSRRTAEVPPWAELHRHPTDAELRSLYRRSRVFLYPSRYEGFGLPPLEAMAAGSAVVATAVGAVPEMLAPGTCGVVVAPGDVAGMARAVLELLADAPRCAAFGAAAEVRARDFDLAPATRAFAAALGQAAARRDPTPLEPLAARALRS